MKRFKFVAMLCCFVFLALAITPRVKAQTTNEKTIMTFTEPFEVPGVGAQILPAGTYVFKLVDSLSDRNIVRITNEDGTHVFTTILAIDNVRLKPTDKTVLTFKERGEGQPEAIKAWFYPGIRLGPGICLPKETGHRACENRAGTRSCDAGRNNRSSASRNFENRTGCRDSTNWRRGSSHGSSPNPSSSSCGSPAGHRGRAGPAQYSKLLATVWVDRNAVTVRRIYSPDHYEAICLNREHRRIVERAGEFDLSSWAVRSEIRDSRSNSTRYP